MGAQAIGNTPVPQPGCLAGTNPRLGIDAQGRATAAWLSDCAIWTARYAPGSGWAPPEVVATLPEGAPPESLWEPSLAVNAAGTALVAWTVEVVPGDVTREVWARVRDAITGWSPAERIGEGEPGPRSQTEAPSVALAANGDGVIVWASDGALAARRAAGQWSAATRLSEGGGAFLPQAYLDSVGRGFAVWNEPLTAVTARLDPASGWQAPMRFGTDDGWSFGGAGSLAFDRDGRAVLVWLRTRGRLQPTAIWSATFAGAWSAWAKISADGAVEDPRVGLNPAGTGIAAWSQPLAIDFVRRETLAWGTAGSAAAAPGADAQSLALAVNERGHALLAWTRTGQPQVGVEASRYANDRFAAIDVIRPGATVRNPAAALDACGNALVVWSETAGGSARVWSNRFDAGCR